ncbi:transposable element Tc1 transposase [Trichonephila clavipes]|nr:transposable element Tc1 transposase [Trichonephila clavipes]
MVWGAISFYGRSNLLRIESNLNSKRFVREVLQPEVVSFLQGIPGAVFQQDNACPHVAKTVRDFCSAQHIQLLILPAYSPDMSPIEHVKGKNAVQARKKLTDVYGEGVLIVRQCQNWVVLA